MAHAMRIKKKKSSLDTARRYSELLLYQASGGSMGKAPAKMSTGEESMTFGEKKGLLDSLIKIALLENKIEEPEDDSGFANIRRKLNAGKQGESNQIGASEADSDAGGIEDDGNPEP